MSKFSGGRRSGRGFGRFGGTVTVIDARMHHSSARNALLGFWVTAVVVTMLAATVWADRMHPILALLAGTALGLVVGAAVWAAIRMWPVVRLLWWWTPEIALGVAVVYGFAWLAGHTTLPWRLAVVVVIVGVPAVIPTVRRRLVAVAWCLIVRHRLRTCFAQFIIANRSGTLPFILMARPTPVGERVWVYLRAGLSLTYLQANLDKLAVACHAREVTAELASDRTAAYVRVDVKRRQVLTATVSSPLVDEVDPNIAPQLRPVSDIPTALDLPDVADPQPAEVVKLGTRKPARPTAPDSVLTSVNAATAVTADGEDVSDWVD